MPAASPTARVASLYIKNVLIKLAMPAASSTARVASLKVLPLFEAQERFSGVFASINLARVALKKSSRYLRHKNYFDLFFFFFFFVKNICVTLFAQNDILCCESVFFALFLIVDAPRCGKSRRPALLFEGGFFF
jgi:hypothetical protein